MKLNNVTVRLDIAQKIPKTAYIDLFSGGIASIFTSVLASSVHLC